MKKSKRSGLEDDLRPEYDFSSLGPAVRGKYASRLKDTVLVTLRPEVAKAFPTADAVNEALQVVMKASAAIRRPSSVRRRARVPKN